MDDTISRQGAIDAVEFGITYAKAINKSTGEVKELFKEGNKALNEAVERLKELPSAEPGKKGKWQYIGFMVVECSECNTQLHALECANFCPNCGAKMYGEE